MELYLLGQKYMKKDIVPSLIYGNTLINLDRIKVDQQYVFSKLQNRICNLGTNKELLKKPCKSDYRVLIDTIVCLERRVDHSTSNRKSNHSDPVVLISELLSTQVKCTLLVH